MHPSSAPFQPRPGLQMPQYPSSNNAQQAPSPYLDQGPFFASPAAYGPGPPGYPVAYPSRGASGVGHQGYFNERSGGGVGQQQPFHPQRQPSSGLPLPGALGSSPIIRAPSSSSSVSIPGTPPNFYSSAFSPPSSVSPVRSRVGHASTPSWNPPIGRRPTLSLAPPLSPTLSMGGSPSPSAGSGGFRERESEERKRKVVVSLPRESGEDENDVEEDEKAGQKRSSFTRTPMDEGAKRRRVEEMEEDNRVAEFSTRDRHYDEVKDHYALPPTIDVYLPGQEGWDDLRQTAREEQFQRLGYPRPNNNPLSARLNSFLEQHNSWPTSFAAASPPSHARTGSLFSSSLPPRLQLAFESRIRPGHGSSFSVGGALSALSRTFSMPGTPSSVGLSSGAMSFAPAKEGGYDRPPKTPRTPSPQSGAGMVETGKKLTLAELSRGFGIEEEEEASAEEREEERAEGLLEVVDPVVDVKREGEESEEASVGSERSKPSRRDSRTSGISMRTGVADDLSDRDAEGEDDLLTNPSNEKLLHVERSPPRTHLRNGSIGTDALGPSRRERAANYSGEEGGYDGSADDEDDLESEVELVLSEEECSNPSDEDLAWERAIVRRRSQSAFEQVSHRGSKGSGPLVDADDPVFVPSDDEVSPAVEKGAHKVTPDFHFPPRGPLPTPPKAQPIRPLPLDDTFKAASSSDPILAPRSTSLNVAAPEFVFGASAKPRLALTPTFGRSTSSLASLGFGSIGGPGSIAADTSEPPSPTKVLPLPRLNPFAGEFEPIFNFTPPADAPTLVIPSPATSPTVCPSTSTRSLRGPLPPVPLRAVEHQENVKRQRVGPVPSGEHHFAPQPDSVPAGFDFPSNSSKSTPNESSQSRRRDSADDDEDDERPLAHLRDQQLASKPTTFTTLGKSTSRTPFNSESRPFTLKPSASFSSDGRVMGFAPVSRRPPIPHFGAPGDASSTGISSNARTSPGDGQRRGEPQREQRQESIDDIALPSISRPRSHAIPIPQRRSTEDLHEEGSPPRQHGSSWVLHPLDNVFDFHEAILTSPRSVTSHTASGTVDEHSEDDDYPLRILEDIIETQFQGLRQELSGFTSLKADLDSLKRDALLDTLVGRMATLLNESRQADSEARNERVTALREVVEANQKRTEESLRAAVEELKAEQASRQLVDAESAKALVVAPPAAVDSLFESRDSLVAALAEAVRQQLSSSSPKNEEPDRLQLTEVVEAAIRPLQALLVENARLVQSAPAPAVVDEDRAALTKKVEDAMSMLERSAATLEELRGRDALGNPVLDLSFVADLKSSIEWLRHQPLDVDSLVAKLSQTSTASVEDLATRLSAKDDTTRSTIDDLRTAFEALSASKSTEQEALASKLAQQVQALLPPPTDFASLSDDVAKAVGTILDSRPAAKIDSSDRLEALVETQAALGTNSLALVEGQALLASVLSRLQEDVTTRFDRSQRQLEEQIKTFAEQAKVSGDVAELESQLAKARNEHGQAKTEKTAVLDRLEADRTRHAAELVALQAAKQSQDDLLRESDIEKALLQQTVERLQEELKSSKTKVNTLDALLLSARDQEGARHATELQHIVALSENQVKTRLLEGEATASQRQIESSSEEKDRLRLELSELGAAHERLSTERRDMDSTLRESIEKSAAAQGEIVSLEKRVTNQARSPAAFSRNTADVPLQDEKISNLQRHNSSKQQALATACQRAVELEKRSAELEDARADLSEVALISSELQARLTASESAGDQLREETQLYRERLSSIDQDLVAMRDAVGSELQESNDRFVGLKEENAQLLQQNADLARELKDAQARQQSTNYPPLSSHPNPYPRTAQSTQNQPYATPPSTYRPWTQSYDLPAPQSRHASSPAKMLYAQSTGSSPGTAHVPSPTPSRLGKAIERDTDGWWGA